MFPHGAQKMLGWYGGNGFSGTMAFFTEPMGMPALVACLVIVGEIFWKPGSSHGFSHSIHVSESCPHHVWCDDHGALATWVFYELVRTVSGRRV